MSRFHQNAYTLVSETFRDLSEMGTIVKPKSYQNKVIEGMEEYITKEMQFYAYTLASLPDPDNLFIFEGSNAKEWAIAEFDERISYLYENPGTAYLIRKDVWEPFLNGEGEFDYSYNQRIMYSFISILKELKDNPDSRQLWMPIFWPEDTSYFGGERRIPCSLGYYFMVREGKLNMAYIQRSGDIIQHWLNDIYLAWLMQDHMSILTGYPPGDLFHITFSLHAYKKDWDKIDKGISSLVDYRGF